MGFLIPGSLVRVQPGVLKSTGFRVLFSFQARGSFVAPASILKSVPGRRGCERSGSRPPPKGLQALFEMLRRSRLRAPSLAEFLKSTVDQVGRIQILHHFRPHDVALGEPKAHRAPRPQQNGIRQMALRRWESPRPPGTGNELMHVRRGFANLPGNFRQGDKVTLVDPLNIRPNVCLPDIADSGQHSVL